MTNKAFYSVHLPHYTFIMFIIENEDKYGSPKLGIFVKYQRYCLLHSVLQPQNSG